MLEGLEKAAREAKKGLWADPQPVSPWEWRKRQEDSRPMGSCHCMRDGVMRMISHAMAMTLVPVFLT
jgi:hypothetical protein